MTKHNRHRHLIRKNKFKNNTIDLHRAVVDSVVLPLYFYSLKDVARYVGFQWQAEDAGGAESVVWYNQWKETGDKKILQKILDYNKDDETTKKFFAKVQNKLHFAIHGHTAAELIYYRADSQKEHMGLTSYDNAPSGKILKTDVTIAKNYLSKEELDSLGRIVNAFLDLAEGRAKRNIPMNMEDWASRLDMFLEFDDRKILQNAGKITKKIADEHALSEFEKYRVVQDRLFMSDFDKQLLELQRKK